MSKNKEVVLVATSKIEADENQPRKTFSPERIADLMKSIEKYGILTPLTVEKTDKGYLLVDGERRLRAAKELKLEEVPVLITESNSELERLIKQFQLQEQHENWTALEKAVAVSKLASDLKMGVQQVADLLSLPRRTLSEYMAFGSLLSKKEFEKNEISLAYANPIVTLRKWVKKQYADQLNEEFDPGQERELERAVIQRVKAGTISHYHDVTKIKDAVKAQPKSIEKFIKETDLTVDKLFNQSKAKVAWYNRNVRQTAWQISSHITRGLEVGLKGAVQGDKDTISALKAARAKINQLLGSLDESLGD